VIAVLAAGKEHRGGLEYAAVTTLQRRRFAEGRQTKVEVAGKDLVLQVDSKGIGKGDSSH